MTSQYVSVEENISLNVYVNKAVNAYFAQFDKFNFSDVMVKLETRWMKCIDLDGGYVEK